MTVLRVPNVFELDSYILDQDTTYWKAQLSNGEVVYQDDNRPGKKPRSAWLRLKKYCKKKKIYPTDMWIIFRSHTEYCGHSDIGFFFSLGVLGSPGMPTEHRFVCGPVINGKIHIKVWRIPEIIEQESELRNIEGNEDKIIWDTNRSLTDMTAQHTTI